ncbi:MAG: lytic transglycosylase domain-containing protein [Deltaproteobacteria bacterium]|nr:lytic transglycosylase domain-containing protein [Deltaproteobacteria bacterium]
MFFQVLTNKRSKLLLVPAAIFILATVACFTVENSGPNPEVSAQWLHLVPGQPTAPRTDFVLPDVVTLCGETIPLNRPAVRDKLEFEFLLAVHHKAQVELWLRRAQRYFPLIEAALKQAGLPDDLKYLAVAESDLRPSVASPAGALGLWQFMPATARQFGLTVSSHVDQRHLPEQLLNAGIKYLTSLKNKFGSWSLAMAAYNAGDGRIHQAVTSQNTKDYYELDLVTETSRYVYRIAALKIVLENAAQYGFELSPEPDLWRPIEFEEVKLTFSEPVSWAALARKQGCDYKTLRLLNPHLSAMPVLKGGPFWLRLPPNQKPVLGT